MKLKLTATLLAWLALAGLPLSSPAIPPLAESASGMVPLASQLDHLRSQVNDNGPVRVIVKLKTRAQPAAVMSQQTLPAQQETIAQASRRLTSSVRPTPGGRVRRFKEIGYVAMDADNATLEQLRASPDVESVVEDRIHRINLEHSIPTIGADQAWASGYTGAGQTVAILDTGVDAKHPFLANKVVAEACFSTNDPLYLVESACPNHQETQTGAGAGAPCRAEDCIHGTHVAGIAAGNRGVAKGAKIIAVQVFSLFNDWVACLGATPCTGGYDSDILQGLEFVYSQRSRFRIASVNLSLGDGSMRLDACDNDPAMAPYRDIVAKLKTAGIATVAASGNSSYKRAIGAPACLSNVISVGATSIMDMVPYFSNTSSLLSLLAPGEYINSSVPGGGFERLSGTSMAAPHVAGAWAVLKQRKPTASVAEVLKALRDTGMPVVDYLAGITKPRIQVDSALAALVGANGQIPPGPLSGIAPVGTIRTLSPVYQWKPRKDALWYSIYIYDVNNKQVDYIFALPSSSSCSDGVSACRADSTLGYPKKLVPGRYTWRVSAQAGISATVDGPWQNFTVAP